MKRNKMSRKLSLDTTTVRALAPLSSAELNGVGGGGQTQTVCPTVMQTHCQSCHYFNTCDC